MKKKQFYLTDRQYRFFRQEMAKYELKESEVLRRIIDEYIDAHSLESPKGQKAVDSKQANPQKG